MKNFRLCKGMIWIYGIGRVDKANNRMCRYYSAKDEEIREGCRIVKKGEVYEKKLFTAKDERFRLIMQLSNKNPLLTLKLLRGKV